MPKLRVATQSNGDRWELRLAGELDVATAGQFTDVLEDAPPGATIVLDLSSLMFMDSSGLRALLQAHIAGQSLVLANPRPDILRVLQIAEVLDLFPIQGTTD